MAKAKFCETGLSIWFPFLFKAKAKKWSYTSDKNEVEASTAVMFFKL